MDLETTRESKTDNLAERRLFVPAALIQEGLVFGHS